MIEPVAIVGRGCVLPGALDPASLWRLVVEGRDAIGPVPEGRWRLSPARALTSDPKDAADRAWSDRGGYVRGLDAIFDPEGFDLDAASIASFDPILRWTLHAVREALREAGEGASARRAGVILGNLSFPTASHAALVERHWLGAHPALGRVLPVIDPRERFHSSFVASITARALRLAGAPSFCLDAACASSLYAIALSCDALRDGRADLMIAGAVNCTDDLFIHVGFCALDALSKSGQSRPFHPGADGLVPAEGVAVVALMRLSDALREGRPVLGVIRGVGLANDGRARNFLAPAQDGQERAMRAAYAQAGLAPSDIGWVECHATGTPIGDATEVRSTARVFEGCLGVAIGSLKANLGHLITTSGAAGLLRVLGAFEEGVRPKTPHLEEGVIGALEGTPLRVLTEREPWTDQRVRRAAISAFGFGGNDAHLIVEEHVERAAAVSVPAAIAPPARFELAIVGIGLRVGPFASARAFAEALSRGEGGRRAEEVVLPLEALRSPPADLKDALAQQTMLLAAALDLDVSGLDRDRTAVLAGMRCDSSIARYGMRWRLPELAERAGLDPRAFDEERESFAPRLDAAGVLGTMPNIPANRINRELDLRGPSYTVSADELSGVRALEIACRALRARELDAALVGAVELGSEPVNEESARALLPASLHRGGDAAVVLLVMRLEDAGAQARPVLAILDGREGEQAGDALRLGPRVEAGSLAPSFGHAHAASGLLHVAAAALCLHRRARPGERAGAWVSDAAREARVEVTAIDGASAIVTLREDRETPIGAVSLDARTPEHALFLPAHAARPRLPEDVIDDAVLLEHAPPLPPAPHDPAGASVRGAIDEADLLVPAPPLPAVYAIASASTPETPIGQDARLVRAPPRVSPVHEPARARRDALPARTGSASFGNLVSSVEIALPARIEATPSHRALLDAIAARQREVAAAHEEFLRTQSELHARFLADRDHALHALAQAQSGSARDRTLQPPPSARAEALNRSEAQPLPVLNASAAPRVTPLQTLDSLASKAEEARGPASRPAKAPEPPSAPGRTGRGLAPNTPPPLPTGRAFSRAELEVHASGRISTIFGPELAPQDAYAVQVRMPAPPLLLADRVTGLRGELASMGKGVVWTETDVDDGAFYLVNGRMPAGLMIEAGQADLFLISWLGADLANQGERAYRLLGCKLTWHRSPPRIGETLAYDIHVDGHAAQGDVRLFFFHYDCHIDGRPALTVRSGQAGFFTKEELAQSAGILWSAEDHEVVPGARVDAPRVPCTRSTFESAALEALSEGDVAACFGEGYEQTLPHVRTPAIAGGRMRLLDRVAQFDPRGGPHGRGYLRAVTRIRPDDWYFSGHFKNDPCMPGTLMLEGCLSAMSFYLIGLGYTLDRDGFRFEPIPDETYSMLCRGQVIPSSKELVYELFVEEVHDGPVPKLYADLLCTVDGLKAFHARRMGIQLVPDWPLTSHPELTSAPDPEPVAMLDGIALGRTALAASAWGPPSMAFGPRYAEFDGLRRAPRLPGPPYHMVSRVLGVEGEPWSKKAGACVEIAYDVPPDAWYFADGASGAMPYSLLLEAALQPCGWLATYTGSTLDRREDLRFRNLDGEGEVLADVRPDAGTLRTRATLTSMTDTPTMVIVGFDVVTAVGEVDVYRLKTVFGFFPDAAFRDQAGLPVSETERALFEASGEVIDLRARPSRFFDGPARLQEGRLALLDEVTFFDPQGGRAGLGTARAEAGVDARAWFFRAHFFQDPVQPGSLGMEAMLALLRFAMLEKGLDEGLSSPRFSPIATRKHRWKYRGQVLPTDTRVSVTLEITTIARGPASVVAEAEASFWIDEKRIYEATIATELVESGACSGAEREPPLQIRRERADLDLEGAARYWRAFLGVSRSWVAEDLYLGLVRRFLRRVHIDPAFDAVLRAGPVVYLANHQTAIETLVLSIISSARSGVPLVALSKVEHRQSWLGHLLAWIFAHPSVREPELMAYFDRDDPASLPALLRSLPRDRSILVHVEGTRAHSCRQPVERVSGVPIDVAIERGVAVVPVRFAGGLPLEPTAHKHDFPVAMGAQDLFIGAPIPARELAELSYKERIERVRRAIAALGPRDEAPIAGDLAFASDVARTMEERGLDLPHAVLACVLSESERPCALTRRILDGQPFDASDPEERWAAALAARLRAPGSR